MTTPRPGYGSLKLVLRVLSIGALVLALSGPVSARPKRVVEIGDENQDGRYTGEDVERALGRCRPGCLLRAGANTYEDVAVVIDNRFPEGLIIEGAGIGATVFRSPVPVQAPVIWIKGGPSGIVLRDFTLDGRKSEQTNASKINDSVGIRVSNPSLMASDSGRVESVAIMHFLTSGILVRDGKGWQIKNNRINDIGCHTKQPCPRMPGKDADRYVKGRRTIGYGVMLSGSGASGAVVENNRVSDVTKIGIEAYTKISKLGSNDRIRDIKILRNRVSGALGAGITSNGGVGIDIIGNEVWDSGGTGVLGNAANGISCGGASERIVVAGNYVHDTDGAGIRMSCRGNDVTLRDNRVERPCRLRLVEQGAIHIVGSREAGRSHGLVVEKNRVDASVGQCVAAIFLVRWRDIRVMGGVYRGGSLATLFFADASRIRLEGLEASSADAPSLWVRSDVTDMIVAADVRISRDAIKDEGASDFVIESRSNKGSSRPLEGM